MNISELIDDLTELREAHGDLDVAIWADHGQQSELAGGCCLRWIDEDGETYADEDMNNPAEGYDKDDFNHVVEIS